MTVFVDELENWGWKMRGCIVESCHMFSDSADVEDLHVMAEKIGMKRDWFQPHVIAPHYDLVASKRQAAIALGAVEVSRSEASTIWKWRREKIRLAQAVSEISESNSELSR